MAGEPNVLTCTASEARPPAVLNWIVPDHLTSNHQDQTDVVKGNSYTSRKVVTITPSASDQGKHISCFASHQILQTDRQCIVNLNVHVLPSNTTIFQSGNGKDYQTSPTVIYVQEGSSASISCQSIGSRPAVELTWRIDDPDIPPGSISRSKTQNAVDDSLFDTFSTYKLHLYKKYQGLILWCFVYLGEDFVERQLVTISTYGSPSTMSTATISFQRRQFLPVKGEDFTMECTYFPPSNVRTVKWKHEETRIASEWCTTASECTPNISNPTKYKLMGDDRSTSLTIINLNTGDNGRYTCNVFNLHGERSATEILKVLNRVPPSRVFMSDAESGRQYLNNANISITAGESFSITCGANRARPPAVLQWLVPEDVTVVHQDQSDVIQDGSYISRKALTITSTRDDHGKILSCIASHPEMQRSLRSSVLLNIHGLPDNVAIIVRGDMLEGSETNITFTALNGYPAPHIHWYIGSRNVTGNSSVKTSINSADRYDVESTLTIIQNRFDHGKRLLCQAAQPTSSTLCSVNNTKV
ncbi:synaptogenesis protein syg-2-like [Lytechinus variegatus]|uniref:synaptogenesis protein syg-2-like n=1 Tax=Lytechinus variegatus TaxID=7654 RepID=UPI001BB1D12A|nr:synaptogenesis protein syg-2-like [Lytechinus variegatus]